MAKPNKDGWIRHRGGVPKDVTEGQWVKVRYRGNSGLNEVFEQKFTYNITWKHFGKDHLVMGDSDIMAYKLIEAPVAFEPYPNLPDQHIAP